MIYKRYSSPINIVENKEFFIFKLINAFTHKILKKKL